MKHANTATASWANGAKMKTRGSSALIPYSWLSRTRRSALTPATPKAIPDTASSSSLGWRPPWCVDGLA